MMLITLLVLIGGMLVLLALRSLRQHRLKERYALLFVAISVPFVALAIWPDAVGNLAGWLHIEYQTVLLLCVTLFFLLLNFKLLSIVSVQERQIASLAQMVGILSAQRRGDDATATPGQPAQRERDA